MARAELESMGNHIRVAPSSFGTYVTHICILPEIVVEKGDVGRRTIPTFSIRSARDSVCAGTMHVRRCREFGSSDGSGVDYSGGRMNLPLSGSFSSPRLPKYT